MYIPNFRPRLTATITLIGTCAMLAATPAQAEIRQWRVTYNDLNLRDDAGVKRLETRVRSTTRQACGFETGLRPLARMQAEQRCFKTAMAKAGKDIEVAVHTARDGTRLASSGAIAVSGK